MMEDVPSTNTDLVSLAARNTAATSTALSAVSEDGTQSPKRKNAKVNNGKPNYVPFHAGLPPRVSYAGAASNAVPTKPSPDPSAASKIDLDPELQSICTKFLVAGETMLRPSRASAGPEIDPSKIPSLLGVLIKS